jgi:two-component system, NtrC family, sensor histidine kinase PilS
MSTAAPASPASSQVVASVASPGDSLVRTPTPLAPVSDQRRRVARLLVLRTIVVTVVLGLSLWILIKSGAPSPAMLWLQSAIIAGTYLATVIFGLLLRQGFSPSRVARPMLATDLALTSALAFVTGGVQSPYIFLYALTIVSAGALSYRRGAVIVTIGALALMIAVALITWARIVPLPAAGVRPWEQSGIELIRTLGINIAAMIGVGALSFIFGDQLQKGAETLATTRRAAADLLSLHQDIVRSLSSGLITTATDGMVLTANHAAAEILRTSPSLLIGRPIDSVLPGLANQLVESTGELRRGDITVPTSDDDLTIGVTVSPLRDPNDKVVGRVINFQDLTDLRRLEAHARRAERMATVGQLAAGVAHEIRNPMASISGSIELLRQSPQTSEDDRALMTIVHREVQRLNGLIGDLLDYANPRAKQPVDFDLAGLVEETVQVARGDQNFADVELTSDVLDKPLHIFADPAKVRQVVWNLIRNAADAASGGGKHVRVEARRQDEGAVVTVIDDGPGIPDALLGRIFDPFVTTKQKGTGLGLATCHAIVVEHGGRIDVETSLGKGTKMVVTIPGTR